jgi:hypothetical protein
MNARLRKLLLPITALSFLCSGLIGIAASGSCYIAKTKACGSKTLTAPAGHPCAGLTCTATGGTYPIIGLSTAGTVSFNTGWTTCAWSCTIPACPLAPALTDSTPVLGAVPAGAACGGGGGS